MLGVYLLLAKTSNDTKKEQTQMATIQKIITLPRYIAGPPNLEGLLAAIKEKHAYKVIMAYNKEQDELNEGWHEFVVLESKTDLHDILYVGIEEDGSIELICEGQVVTAIVSSDGYMAILEIDGEADDRGLEVPLYLMLKNSITGIQDKLQWDDGEPLVIPPENPILPNGLQRPTPPPVEQVVVTGPPGDIGFTIVNAAPTQPVPPLDFSDKERVIDRRPNPAIPIHRSIGKAPSPPPVPTVLDFTKGAAPVPPRVIAPLDFSKEDTNFEVVL